MVSFSEAADLSAVPKEYQELEEAFSKDRALSLPPYHPYDCCIELLPGALLPSIHLYNLSSLEQGAKKRYVTDSLAKGLIRPSSHVWVGFFFVQKKDGSLRSCIRYQGLNKFRIKNKYPLPLHDSTFSLLYKARSFTKLNLRKECHFVWFHQIHDNGCTQKLKFFRLRRGFLTLSGDVTNGNDQEDLCTVEWCMSEESVLDSPP